jgi:23S rRNA (guanosine2251-2'-O)-methyltransferase
MKRKSRIESRGPRAKGRESRVESRETGGVRREARGGDSKSRVSERSFGADRGESKKAHVPLSTSGSSLIFGLLPVLEALRAGSRRVEKILIAEGGNEKRLHEIITLARENHLPFQKAPRQNLSKLVEPGANHQGVIAFVAAADYYDADRLLDEVTEKIAAGEKPLVMILDGVEDPRNLGAILRTAECAGVDGVFIPERRAVGLNETVAKTSAGAAEYVKVAKVTNLNRLIEDLQARHFWVVGTSLETEKSYTEWDWTQPTVLVMGSEGKGLHRLVAENCDALIRIPLRGKIESLNVSVATGVILFEAIRQRSN